ncbi:hypothetical protein GJ744_009037 [Endocarpon pusillum]|uniref:Uncharacterized protein n=1 Tax=Endocarpon pusillum TaxID=364733 RepID=A0A8H7E4V3_9EURO|nr:hypothetical protein GJ744_009037 [Endocarpon pusillum]
MDRFDIDTAQDIYYWAKSKRNEIELAFNMKGGWEAWLQVELALWLGTKPNVASVMREQHVYTDGSQAVDLIVTNTNDVRNMIELKCESINQDCNIINGQVVSKKSYRGVNYVSPKIPSIAKRLEVECNRKDKVAPSNQPYQYTVIGMSLTQEAHDFVNAEHDSNRLYFLPLTAQKLGGAPDNFCLWYKSYMDHV